ncbi:MAG TPA: DUF1232 domain-containing protein [Acidimicrobiales bacterium]|nr:DUF1232 domain-containing protein [Acidimicrobiales bacterium]
MRLVGVLLVCSGTLVATWVGFIVALAVFRPKGIDVSEAKRILPDIVRLLRSLARDPSTSRTVRRRLSLLLAYLALPVDLVPDFIPVLGYADDVIIVALVLRSVVRRAGPTTIEQQWTGTPRGLAIVRRLGGLR